MELRSSKSKGSPTPPLSRSPTLISVIIPALNEATRIEATLAPVCAQAGPLEVIVVDGGSEDDTAARAAKAGAQVLSSPRSRARQMNCGAEAASGDVFLFLHADTLLPTGGLAAIRRALADPAAAGGTFRLRFDRETPWLRFYSLCTHLPWRRLCFGDRGLFARRTAFEAVGGFPDWPVFEDLELADRLHRQGRFCYLPEHVTTAARRFERNGPFRQQLRNLFLWSHYLAGTNPEAVAHRYDYD